MTCNVYGIGNALVDIQAQVSDEILEKLDFSKGFMTLIDEATQQRVLAALDGIPLSRGAGGSAANTVIGVAQFGGTGAFAGKVADDEVGNFFLQDMRDLGVAIEVPPASEGQSGTCVVLITDDAQRTMLTTVAVSGTLSPDDIDEEEIRKAEYIYIEGYLFAGESTKAAALKSIEYAVRHGVKVALTVSDPFVVNMCRDEILELIDGPVDLLFCNLEEARALTQLHDPADCAKFIHDRAAAVALTLGPDGSILMEGNRLIPIEGVSVEAVDTTGAGDMYAAGLLYGITNGLTWKQAGHLASHAAARVVSQVGARLAKPFTPEEIQELLG
ncbi:MAG: adenosine kinase [Planctomycetota bacterium]|nr:adenosine kinase [Planctomycetota bacterium]MDA1248116.1 adenosine kinase [Planctomycetota bacterium]